MEPSSILANDLYTPTDLKVVSPTHILSAETKFSHSIQDGRVRILNHDLKPENLITYQCGIGAADLLVLGAGQPTFVIAGGHNGVIYVSDLDKDNQIGNPVVPFKVSTGPKGLDNYEDKFIETIYEHEGHITNVAVNPTNKLRFLTAGDDSSVQVWDFAEPEIKFIESISKG